MLPACCDQHVVLPAHSQAVQAVDAHEHPTTCIGSLSMHWAGTGVTGRPTATFEGEHLAAQRLCFNAPSVRSKNVGPVLISAPNCLPGKPRAAPGLGHRLAGLGVRTPEPGAAVAFFFFQLQGRLQAASPKCLREVVSGSSLQHPKDAASPSPPSYTTELVLQVLAANCDSS